MIFVDESARSLVGALYVFNNRKNPKQKKEKPEQNKKKETLCAWWGFAVVQCVASAFEVGDTRT